MTTNLTTASVSTEQPSAAKPYPNGPTRKNDRMNRNQPPLVPVAPFLQFAVPTQSAAQPPPASRKFCSTLKSFPFKTLIRFFLYIDMRY